MESGWNSVTKRALLFSGLWPYQEKRARFLRVNVLTVIIFSLIIPQVAQFCYCDGNVRCIMLTVPAFMLMLTVLAKLYTCQFNSNKIKSLADHLRDDWEKLDGTEEHQIMEKYAANARFLCLLHYLYACMSSFTFCLFSVIPKILNIVLPLNESRPSTMPYEVYYFVDNEKYYFYIIFHIIVSVFIILTALVAHDCMFLVYIEHVCSLFTVAGFRLETASRNDRNDANNRSNDRKMYDQKIAMSVYVHWRALRFVEILEDIFCTAFAVQMIIVVVTMSITLLHMSLQFGEIREMIKMVAYISSQVVHIFYFSLEGQKLIDHSVQLRDKIYNSFWYEIPVESQRLLLYVMRRSLEPNFLSAGKIYVFSLKSFTTVIQSSISYFTVLASFQ